MVVAPPYAPRRQLAGKKLVRQNFARLSPYAHYVRKSVRHNDFPFGFCLCRSHRLHLSIGSLGEGCQVYFGKALYVANPQGNDKERESRHQRGRSWTLEKKTV